MRTRHDPARRAWLRGAAGLLAPVLPACSGPVEPAFATRWVGADHGRGHRLREAPVPAAPAVTRRAGALVVGAGVAGLSAARALLRGGVDDVQVLELEDAPGGNSRGHTIAGMACPLGAHYLPLPGEDAVEVIELLEDLGLRRSAFGRPVYDERHLCHSPQERLFIEGHWHEGLLPPVEALPAAQRAATLAQYRRFAGAVAEIGAGRAFRVPTMRAPWSAALAELDALTFASWLDGRGLTAPALRWYLDYCCRDDYGAGAAQVSAWAGLHYFASRHGFQAPGDEVDARDAVLTWPEGNAWLATRMAAALGERVHGGAVVLRVVEGRHAVEVDVWQAARRRIERWVAPQAVLAVPLFVAQRLLDAPPAALVAAVAAMRHAPWLVASLRIDGPLPERPGAPPSWDNVVYASASLGYVDAMHQSTRPYPGPTVLSAYWALGGNDATQRRAARRRLLEMPAEAWVAQLLADLAPAHPELASRVRQADLMRYGHAMSIPCPGVRGHPALQALQSAGQGGTRIRFAHADLSGYSVFEEACHHGTRAAAQALAALEGTPLSRASALRSRPAPPARRG